VGLVGVYNQQQTQNGGDAYPRRLMGYAGRVTYGYADKYLAEFSLGYNGSENFAKGYRFGTFPAGSIGYIITGESFMDSLKDYIPYLKIRASMGLIGNDKSSQSRFLYMGQYGVSSNKPDVAGSGAGFSFGTTNPTGTGGIAETRTQNNFLTWETSLKRNIGIDGHLFRNELLSFSVDIFDEKRKDILMSATNVVQTAGLSSAYGNIGSVNSYGYEVEVIHRNKIQKVQYSIKANASFARNNIDYYGEPAAKPAWLKQEGYSIGRVRGYQVVGFFQNEEEINEMYNPADPDHPTIPLHTQGRIVPGDLRFEDVDKNGIINTDDMKAIGYSTIPEITYAVTPTISWNNFELTAMFQGATNVSTIPEYYEFMAFQHNYWTPENTRPSSPSLHMNVSHGNRQPNSFIMQNASYLRLKNANFSYNIPQSICKKLHAKKVLVYISGTNLHTWTKLFNWDPEENTGGNSGNRKYPIQKVYNIGININF
jgi:TonB-linked SusC/RagA family outer membrane protein